MAQDNWYNRKGMSKADKKWFDNWAENSNYADVQGVFFALIALILLAVLYYFYAMKQDEYAIAAAKERAAHPNDAADLEVAVLAAGEEQEWYNSTAGLKPSKKAGMRKASPRRKT